MCRRLFVGSSPRVESALPETHLCPMLPSRSWLHSTNARPFLLAFLVTGALVVGLVACDSGGSNEQGEDPEDEVVQTFTVTVDSVDSSYSYSDQNDIGVAYAIDGNVGEVITLERGRTYEFEMGEGVDPNQPFYIGTSAEGGGGDEFRQDPAMVTTGTVTFTPSADAPGSLYYVCGNHVYMGGGMDITSPSGDPGDDY